MKAVGQMNDEQSLIQELERAWKRSDELFRIAGEAWLERPIPLRHPLLFYLGHLPAFGWNQIGRGVLGRPPIDAQFDTLFERGIDPLDASAAAEQSIDTWPPVERVLAYRDEVREALLEAVPDVRTRADRDELAEHLRVYAVVLEHELMHHETLVYLLQELDPKRKVAPPECSEPAPGAAPRQERVPVPGGRVRLGADRDTLTFGWDNEFPPRLVEVERFAIDRYPVTIAAYRDFVDSGGYRNEGVWSAEDWAWIRAQGMEHPRNWLRRDGAWKRRTMFSEVDLDDVGGWPVIVSCAEADAFARWRGGRLASEAELHRAAFGGRNGGPEQSYPWGEEWPDIQHGNFDFQHFDPVPVDRHPAGASDFGVEDLVGNGWEWTASIFGPYPGFEPWIRTYPGYSTDFFDGSHRVLFGASWSTDRRLLRRSLHNWFQRHYPWAATTFRCAWPS